MNFNEFKKSLDQPAPVYILKTDQEYFKRKIREFCEERIESGARSFDWSVFDLPEDAVERVVEAARTLPWVSPHRWIFLKNGHLGGAHLAEYLKNPSPRTVLVVDAAKQGKGWPRGLPTLLLESKIPAQRWVAKTVEREGYSISRDAAAALVELVGEDLGRLRSELEKQFLFLGDSGEITLETVHELTLNARQYDVFSLIRSTAQKDAAGAIRVLQRLFETGTSPQAVLGMLHWNFRRLLAAREMLARGVAFQSVLKELKIWTYKGREREVRNSSSQVLRTLLTSLRDTDRALKTTQIDAKSQLETIVLSLGIRRK